jgi:8-oxo-dGTP pyrophosphatase MutT (NUDIX family)
MKVYGCILINNFGEVLLVKGRLSKKWSFPKGHKQGGESYLDCAVRETLEETGVDLRSEVPVSFQRLSVGEYYFFEVEEMPLSPADTDEIVDARWMSLSEIRSSPCNVDVNNFLLRMRRPH